MQVAQGGLAYTLIHPDELRRRIAHGESFSVVDARSQRAWRASGETMMGAIRLRRDEILARRNEIPKGRGLILLADLPQQEELAFELLRDGFTDVYLIEGGFDAYVKAGGPTEPIR
ncbi:MAG TPA: rhodanese-like domain-containing protein [Vulgatibacter sp.]|nr:rhodanese-like domain-containing protein [Vulgatibacter sp.]